MAMGKETSTGAVEGKAYAFVRDLEIGKAAEVKLMICRSWDTHTAYGTYVSTDFIGSDEQGDVIQLSARSNVAHHFIPRLKAGSVYLLNHFDVVANKDSYRIMKDNKVLIQLNGSTFIRRQPASEEPFFVRHPFTCIEMEDMVLTSGKYVIDVVGRVLNVGEAVPQKTGALTLEFDMVNERGRRMRATLWGNLGPSFKERVPAAGALYCIILTSVSVKKAFNGNLSLSSTSATQVIDDTDILTLAQFIDKMSGVDLPTEVHETSAIWQLPAPKESSLAELLALVRKGKKHIPDDVYKVRVEITNIRLKNSWYYNTCSVCKARKSVSRRFNQHWCESCNDVVPEILTRFRIQCDVTDGTATTVIVLFDETAEELTKANAASLLPEVDADTCNTVMPNAVANLLNTKIVVLLKAMSYYEHGPYESFNCVKVYPEEIVPEKPLIQNLDDDLGPEAVAIPSKVVSESPSALKALKRTIEVPTPTKVADRVTRRKFVVTSDSDDDEGIASDGTGAATTVSTDA